jgi:glycosyltransferase involved in cell wall biosynthesis
MHAAIKPTPPKYAIVTPVRDEAFYIRETIKSVAAQTVTPTKWVIVDDGSTDGTGEIIDEFAKSFDWALAVHRENRGFRSAGGGVVEAFYEGYNCVYDGDWDFIVKLDGDLLFEADYFERCLIKFLQNTELGIGGGEIYNRVGGRLLKEKNPQFHVRGATKIYRRACWDGIDGLIRAPGWDTLDEVKANMLGWKTCTFADIHVVQLKSTGSADGSWKNWVKNGRGSYISCYHPLFMAAKCVRHIFAKPYLLGAAALFWGFFSCYFSRVEQISDENLKRYIRQQQLRKLMLRRSIWN